MCRGTTLELKGPGLVPLSGVVPLYGCTWSRAQPQVARLVIQFQIVDFSAFLT